MSFPFKPATDRFSTRAESYARYRPGYPARLIEVLESGCGLSRSSIVADVGSGTGILSEMFLRNSNRVFGVEPNKPMRELAEDLLRQYPGFVSIDGTAEVTNLDSASVELITAAQAFHWFDREKTKNEFARILKPDGWVVLIWNERRLDTTPFLRDYEELLLNFGTDYQDVRHENVVDSIAEFFAPEPFHLQTLDNYQHFDFESLKGRVRSASYTPEPDDPKFEPMLSRLREIFDQNQVNGIVTFEYDTRIYYGHLKT